MFFIHPEFHSLSGSQVVTLIYETFLIQSNGGNSSSALQISKMVPEGTTDCYVKVEENRLYYVLKDGSTGSINIW